MAKKIEEERWELLEHIDELTKKPLFILSFVWLVIIVLELTRDISQNIVFISYIIWVIFIFDFIIEFIIAPDKERHLKKNWLLAVSLLIPALRVFRVFRITRFLSAARAVRSATLARLITSLNRSMRAIRATLGQRKLGFVFILTTLVVFAGAAGIYFFENPTALKDDQIVGDIKINSYGDALWWTAMIITTIGSEYWPVTAEGRILTFLLSLYAFAVFGYITAALASILIGKEKKL